MNATDVAGALRWFVSDRHGRVVIAQPPNGTITACAATALAAHVLPAGPARTLARGASRALLAAWAWMELVDGDSPFRRTLGGAVLAGMLVHARPRTSSHP